MVDVERARTVKGWLPRRLGKFYSFIAFHFTVFNLLIMFIVIKFPGGGLGGTRRGGPDVNIKHSGREDNDRERERYRLERERDDFNRRDYRERERRDRRSRSPKIRERPRSRSRERKERKRRRSE